MTTVRVETFKMNHSLQQIVLTNAPESDRIVTSYFSSYVQHFHRTSAVKLNTLSVNPASQLKQATENCLVQWSAVTGFVF